MESVTVTALHHKETVIVVQEPTARGRRLIEFNTIEQLLTAGLSDFHEHVLRTPLLQGIHGEKIPKPSSKRLPQESPVQMDEGLVGPSAPAA